MKFDKKTQLLLMASLPIGGMAMNAIASDSITELPTTVVEAAQESSVSHTIKSVSAADLERYSISNIEDTTRYTPGVQVNDGGNRFGDDGFNIRGLEGDAVAVTVDGVSLGETLNPPTFAPYGMYGSTRGQTELEHVKAIVITKGPSSVSNGSGALAGSVAYTTLSPSDILGISGDGTQSSIKTGLDSRSDEFMVNFSIANRSGGLESLLQYTKRDANETEAHSSGLDVEGANRGLADSFDIESEAILAKISYEIAEGQRLGLVYDTTDRNVDGNPVSRNSTDAYPSSYDNFSILDENNKERYGLFYELENSQVAAFDSVSASLNFQELFSSGVTSFEYTSQGQSYLRQEDRNFTQESTALNVDFEKLITGDVQHGLSYGVKWESKELANVRFDRRFNGINIADGLRDGYPERDSDWVPQTETDIFSAYFRDQIQFGDRFSLTAGLRYDSTSYDPSVNDTFQDVSGTSVVESSFDAFASELVADFEFADGQSVLASISQGYKAPTAQDLYLSTNGSATIVDVVTGVEFFDLDTIANPDLEAEESTSFELGYKLESERASLVVTAYKTEYDNMIQNVGLSSPYGANVTSMACGRFGCSTSVAAFDEYSQPQNVGSVDVQGIEIDAAFALTDNLYTSFTYATISGEYNDSLAGDHNEGDDLETASPDSATLGFGYQSDDNDWGVTLHAVWFDSVDESGDLSFTSLNNGSGPAYYPESYTVFDLTAFYNISENLSLNAAAYNLSDESYFRWEVINSVRNGSGGFFGGVAEEGYRRYSEPGRSYSVNIKYTF